LQLARIWETATIMADEVLFLFNHDAPHQVAHIAGIARALYESRTGLTVTCATATPAIRDRVAAILGAEAGRGVTWLDIGLPGWLETALALPNKVAPVRRLMRLRHHAGRINAARVVVSAERTCLSIRDDAAHRAGRGARFAYVPHGAGDRMVSFHPERAGSTAFWSAGPRPRANWWRAAWQPPKRSGWSAIPSSTPSIFHAMSACLKTTIPFSSTIRISIRCFRAGTIMVRRCSTGS
jgi:hypothetical protein